MTRLIITPTDGSQPELLQQCIASVEQTGIAHLIIQAGPNDWEEKVFAARNAADFVGRVDHDDLVIPEVVVAAFDLIESLDVGLVYTDLELINFEGEHVADRIGDKTLQDLIITPGSIDHFTVQRKNTVSQESLDLFNETHCLYDWISKGEACIKHGYARLPQIGYKWRRWPGQLSLKQQRLYADNRFAIRSKFKQWIQENPQ